MIENIDFLDKNGNSIIGIGELPMYSDIFLKIESDNLGAGLNFRVKLTNQDTNQYYNLKLYPKIGSNRIYTYISTLLRYLSNSFSNSSTNFLPRIPFILVAVATL